MAPRITGDFSNASVANRLMMCTNVTNAVTRFGIIPNGTATEASVQAFSASDPNNAVVGSLTATPSEVQLSANKTGTLYLAPGYTEFAGALLS